MLLFPFVPKAAEVRGWRGKAERMEQGRRRERLGEGSAGGKALPCHGASRGHAGHGFRGTEPSPARQNHRGFCPPPSPPCPAMLSGGGRWGCCTERGDTGPGGQQSPDPPHTRPGMLCPSSPSTHLHSPPEGETEARTGAWGGTGAGRQRAGNELRLRKQQLPAGPALPSSPLPSPPRPSPPLGCPTLPRPGGPSRAVPGEGRPLDHPLCAAAGVGLEQRDERHSKTPAGLIFFLYFTVRNQTFL